VTKVAFAPRAASASASVRHRIAWPPPISGPASTRTATRTRQRPSLPRSRGPARPRGGPGRGAG
jgi:hypothetical protein